MTSTRKQLMRNVPLAMAALIALGGSDDCGGPPIIENNGFDLWCGNRLCLWEVEKGDINRVPTWHAGDPGVSLLGADVAISQLSALESSDTTCLKFDMLTMVSPSAEVTLELDFFDDGTVDESRLIPTTDWATVTYLISLPEGYQGVRFRIRKTGPGRAVLAQIYAEKAGGCANTPAPINDKPFGASCLDANTCASDACTDVGQGRTCGDCGDDGGCAVGEECGIEFPDAVYLNGYASCGPAGRHVLGEDCFTDAECVTGTCSGGICAECRSNVDCLSGARCGRVGGSFAPNQCGPRARDRATGELCLVGEDCVSNQCFGAAARKVCEVGGQPCDDDSECPIKHERCLDRGFRGGTCR